MILPTELSIRLSGLRLSEEEKTSLYAQFRRLYEETPDQSAMQAEVTSRHGRFQAKLSIKSFVGSFLAQAEGLNLREVLAEVSEMIHQDLLTWKAGRFLPDVKFA